MQYIKNPSSQPFGQVLSSGKGRHGATTVEFAMVSVVLVLLIFGGIEMTRVSMLRHSVDHAAYVAARSAIIPGAKTADVIANAETHLSNVGLSGATVTVNPAVIQDDTSVVEVQISLPIAENSFVTPEFLFGNLVGRSALMTERTPMQMSASLPEPPPPPPPPEPPAPPEPPTPPGPPTPPPPPPPPPPML